MRRAPRDENLRRMSKIYSNDLRERVLDAYESGLTYEEVARLFSVSVTFIRTLRALHKETGDIQPRPHGGGNPGAFSIEDLEVLKRWNELYPDMYLREYVDKLAEERGIHVSEMAVCRAFKKLGITRKKKTNMPRNNERKSSVTNGKSTKN